MNIDIGNIITEHLTSQERRKDHGGLSVTDVSNGCARQKWWELHRGLRKQFDGNTLKKFEYGYALEKVVEKSLKAKGYEILPPAVVIFRPDGRIINMAAEFYDADPAHHASQTDIVGHPDIIAEHTARQDPLIVEVKSTGLFKNGAGPPQHPSYDDLRLKNGNYILQGAAYAWDLAKEFAVYVSDRMTGIDKTYWFETAKEYPAFQTRAMLMKAALNPDVEPEPTLPQWTRNAYGRSYLCKGCPVKTCKNNIS